MNAGVCTGNETAGRVEIADVSVMFKGSDGKPVRALAKTNLVLEPGSFTTLIGPSGCGKSTLLNLVAGFNAPTEGVVLVDRRPVTEPTPDIGVVFQSYALFPWFSAAGNVEFALKRFGYSRSERHRRALAALEEVGLSGQGSKFPGQLSGGMRQRVALARTFAAKPKVLLMDEPFGALDAQTRMSMHELLMQIWEVHRITVLFVTHDIDEALLLSDRIHVMSAAPGRIIETLAINCPHPRSVEAVDTGFLINRNKIVQLLRQAKAVQA